MPGEARAKTKTHSGAKKRFQVCANGRIKKRSKNRNHILTKKAQGRKRRLRKGMVVAASDKPAITSMLDGC